MSEEFEEIVLKKLEKLDTIETEVKETKQGLQNLTKRVEDNTLRLGKLEIEVKDTGEVVNYLNQRFTKFDYEINKKIDTLFDAYATNKDKYLVHEKDIASLNAKVFNQDIRISNLEDKVLTA